MTTDPTTQPNQPTRATELPLSRPGSPKAYLHPSGAEIAPQRNSGDRAGVRLTQPEREDPARHIRAGWLDGAPASDWGLSTKHVREAWIRAADLVAERYLESLIAARVDAALGEVERRVAAQYRAYLSSSSLSPDWIAGWHSSNLHATHHVRDYRNEQTR